MIQRLLKLLVAFLAALSLILIFYFTEPPKSWDQASIIQILSVFIPILIFFTFLLDIFINYFPHSFLAALGILVVIVLQANNQLNPLTGLIVLLIIFIALKLFPKLPLLKLRGLFMRFRKIPKLTKIERQKKKS